jgi:hypothetical protein
MREVEGAEALVGGMLTVGFASVALALQQAAADRQEARYRDQRNGAAVSREWNQAAADAAYRLRGDIAQVDARCASLRRQIGGLCLQLGVPSLSAPVVARTFRPDVAGLRSQLAAARSEEESLTEELSDLDDLL